MANKNVFAGVGVSANQDSYVAATEAAKQALKECGQEPTFSFVFVGSNHDLKKTTKGLKDTLGNSPFVGVTTCGEYSSKGPSRHTCTVLTLSSKYIKFGVGVSKGVLKNPKKATKEALNKAMTEIKIDKYVDPYINFMAMKNKKPEELVKMKPYVVMTFTPGLGATSIDNDAVVQTIMEVIGRYVPVIGAGASSDRIFVDKFLFTNEGIYDDAIITLFIVSDVKLGFGLAHGFKPMDINFRITKLEKEVNIKELDGCDAIKKYAEVSGVDLSKFVLRPETLGTPEAQNFLRHPFGIQTLSGNYILRHILAEEPQKSLRFCFRVRENLTLVPMDGKPEEILKAGGESVAEAKKDAGSDKVAAILAFGCLLRQLALGPNLEKDVDMINKEGNKAPVAGFYGVGQLGFFEDSPVTSQQMSLVTMVITDTLVSEK